MSRTATATRQQVRATAVTRLACSWLLTYPDPELLGRMDEIHAAVVALPDAQRAPLMAFLDHVADTPLVQLQQHYVAVFDMRRRACLYLSYWTDGETRNRGQALLRFKHTYVDSGWTVSDAELPDHLAVVLEFAAIGDTEAGETLLGQHRGPIGLLHSALDTMESAYVHVLDAVVSTLPESTPELEERMAALAASGPPVEQVGLEPFPTSPTLIQIGVRR